MKNMNRNKKRYFLFALLLSASLLSACAFSGPAAQNASSFETNETKLVFSESEDKNKLSEEDASPEKEKEILEHLEDLAVPLSAGTGAASSAVSGTVYQKGGTVIDASHSANGYIVVKHTGSSKRLKVQIKKDSLTYNYDLNNTGTNEVFPLQMGDGSYSVRTLENVAGSSYKELCSVSFPVKLSSVNAPFLNPNQYVNYTSSSQTVKKAAELCANSKTDVEKLKAVYSFMIQNIKYDYEKAATVTSGYLPNVDVILSSKKGICFDYSAVMASMLRSQGVPCKLVVGSVDAVAATHSWNEVYLQGTGWITIKIENTKTGWKLMDPTFGASNSVGSGYTMARIY